MTKYEIKKIIGESKNGKEYKCLQIVAHTDAGDYLSSYIFPSSFRPAKTPDWFGDFSSTSDRDDSLSIKDVYSQSSNKENFEDYGF